MKKRARNDRGPVRRKSWVCWGWRGKELEEEGEQIWVYEGEALCCMREEMGTGGSWFRFGQEKERRSKEEKLGGARSVRMVFGDDGGDGGSTERGDRGSVSG